MVKFSSKKLFVLLVVTFLNISSPLAFAANSWAQKPTQGKIDPLSEQLRKSRNVQTRLNAISALSRVGSPKAVRTLITGLKDPNIQVRSSTAKALKSISIEVKASVPDLGAILKNQRSDRDIRASAAEALGKIGSAAKVARQNTQNTQILNYVRAEIDLKNPDKIGRVAQVAAPNLRNILKDSNLSKEIRTDAADTLGNISTVTETAINDISVATKDPDINVANTSNETLSNLKELAKKVVPYLRFAVLKDPDKNVRRIAADSLGKMGVEAKDAVPDLIAALKDKDENVRSSAANALGKVGIEAEAALSTLTTLLKDNSWNVRISSANALGKIADSLRDKVNISTLYPLDLDKAISNLETALKTMKNQADFSNEQIAAVSLPLDDLKKAKNQRLWISAIFTNPLIQLIIAYLLLYLFYEVLLRFRPLWLLRLNDVLKPLDIPVSAFNGNIKISLRSIIFIQAFAYRTKVLDAWITAHLEAAKTEFQRKDTVHDRTIHISTLVLLKDNSVDNSNEKPIKLTGEELRSEFSKNRGCLLISGEGGTGKTSLACQIGKGAIKGSICQHRMLPVLIEEDLEFNTQTKHPLREEIRRQLRYIADEAKLIDEELLEHLLQQRRILVIVDRFSELSEKTRQIMETEIADFPINALVITSRSENTLETVTKTIIHPLPLTGRAELAGFMEGYLKEKKQDNTLEIKKFFQACAELGNFCETLGDRKVTVLLATLYTDVLIAVEEKKITDDLPKNIPDLMLAYVNEINRSVKENRMDDRTVQKDLKVIAWECLQQNFLPQSGKRDKIITEMKIVDAELHLDYLENSVHLIKTIGHSKDQIKFSLDPLAEYFAALHLVDIYGNDENSWLNFLLQDAINNQPDNIKSFLLALMDCYLAKFSNAQKDLLITEIESLINVSQTNIQPNLVATP